MPRRPLENLTESMFYVLLALKTRPMCGMEIAAFLERATNGRLCIGPATLYTVLSKFEEVQYIEEIAVEGRKRTYRITSRGMDAYNAELGRLTACLRDAETIGGLLHECDGKLARGAGDAGAVFIEGRRIFPRPCVF